MQNWHNELPIVDIVEAQMLFLNHKNLSTLMFTAIAIALSGCGSDESSSDSKGRWLEAADAQNNFGIAAQIEAIESKSESPDKSCEGIIGRVREAIKNPSEYTTGMLVIVSPCSDAGLEFGEEVRCESGRLQVKCL
jgi:hypothetical protein